jgi:hypothetical protein
MLDCKEVQMQGFYAMRSSLGIGACFVLCASTSAFAAVAAPGPLVGGGIISALAMIGSFVVARMWGRGR